MKRKNSVLAVIPAVVLALMLVSSCASKSELERDPNIPDFAANPPNSDEYIFGIGSARFPNNTSQSMQAADARARADLATKINTEVQSMIIDYSRIAGIEGSQNSALTFYENVSRQISNATLRGVEVVKRERARDGTYWTLVQISKRNAAQDTAQIIESEASRYAEFKAMEALKMMEQQLNIR